MVKVYLQTGKEAWSFHSIWQLDLLLDLHAWQQRGMVPVCYSLLDYLEASEG